MRPQSSSILSRSPVSTGFINPWSAAAFTDKSTSWSAAWATLTTKGSDDLTRSCNSAKFFIMVYFSSIYIILIGQP